MTGDQPTPDPLEEPEDPVVEECIRDALAPYVGILSPEELAEHRRLLIVFITTHPVASPLFDRLRKRRSALAKSDEVARAGVDVDTEEARRRDVTSGGRR